MAGVATLGSGLVAAVGNVVPGAVAVVALALAVAIAWEGVLRAGLLRALCLTGAALAVVGALVVLAIADLIVDLFVLGAGAAVTAGAVRVAFRHKGSAGGSWQSAPPARQPVLLVNPRSGGGKAERAGLAYEARVRGIMPIILRPGDDLATLAARAVADGADVLGVAGGDGSLATVAEITVEHDVTFVCVPAGTRNHFALDLGVRRDDLIGALDAFVDGVERTVDLAHVNDRPFLNNVSFGAYAQAIRQPRYRQARVRTLLDSVRDVLGPDGRLPTFRFDDDAGRERTGAAMLLVSNNAYALDRALGRGTRPRLDSGLLGVVALGSPGGDDGAWTTRTFTASAPDEMDASLDGEAITLQPPLRFASHPGRLRVRISAKHPGVSPSALMPRRLRMLIPRLASIAVGRG